MRKVCSVCGAKEAVFFGGASIRSFGGICICKECYFRKYGNLDAHPVPDEMNGKSLSNVDIEFPFPTEVVFTDPLFKTQIKIHKLMWWNTTPDRAFYNNCFFGIERYSKKLVYVLFSEDDTSSDGGPSYANVTYLPYANFFGILNSYPEPVRREFADLSDETIEKYLNFYLPLDMTTDSYLITQKKGGIVKLAYYGRLKSWFYAEVKESDYESWRKGKSILHCIDTVAELGKVSLVGKESLKTPLPLMFFPKEIKTAIDNCINNSDIAAGEAANFIVTKRQSLIIEERSVPHEVSDGIFNFITENFLLNKKVK